MGFKKHVPEHRMDLDPEWRERAACQYVDPETFYPAGEDAPPGRANVQVGYSTAKEFCQVSGCPVRFECLEDALAVEGPNTFGVRGGTTPNERREILRERRQQQQVMAA
jgi:WhiB family redox-sensing transcriptional regulator